MEPSSAYDPRHIDWGPFLETTRQLKSKGAFAPRAECFAQLQTRFETIRKQIEHFSLPRETTQLGEFRASLKELGYKVCLEAKQPTELLAERFGEGVYCLSELLYGDIDSETIDAMLGKLAKEMEVEKVLSDFLENLKSLTQVELEIRAEEQREVLKKIVLFYITIYETFAIRLVLKNAKECWIFKRDLHQLQDIAVKKGESFLKNTALMKDPNAVEEIRHHLMQSSRSYLPLLEKLIEFSTIELMLGNSKKILGFPLQSFGEQIAFDESQLRRILLIVRRHFGYTCELAEKQQLKIRSILSALPNAPFQIVTQLEQKRQSEKPCYPNRAEGKPHGSAKNTCSKLHPSEVGSRSPYPSKHSRHAKAIAHPRHRMVNGDRKQGPKRTHPQRCQPADVSPGELNQPKKNIKGI